MSLSEPNFIDRDPQAITGEIVAMYEQLSGKTLYPAQVERVLIDVISYRETLVRIGIQEAAKQNLVAYARAPMLDYLGELVGVTRLPAQPARTMLRFTMGNALATSLLVPAGTRVEGADGTVSFATDAPVTLSAGQLTVDATATCEETGSVGNDWQAGQIANMVDELGDVEVIAANINLTSGGVDEEIDDRLRDRIRQAPESFTVAGSRLAYRHHAMSAHQDIVDVAVMSPSPGVVHLYPLVITGLPDANMLSLVKAACSDDKVRPLTDFVDALPPTPVDYTIDAQLVLYMSADAAGTVALARANVEAYANDRAAGLSRDVVPSQVIAALQASGVYQVMLISPDLKSLTENEWARCLGISLTMTGTANG